ncbi:MFS transporter [Dactylosporangium sucinum]|uniref:MFS transporter n=1 Tax=Dactylosporangium sucinum TaxID=1424081 RepID=A0A917UHF1_9ACTN|nr:MFS transporter [Dactylosporangium sucinum]GGM89402.1 MFS transporter [Dactylosporangium sucinum]
MQNRRALTIGMVSLVTFAAFEAVAVTAAMPTVARALDGLALYGFTFGGPLATSVVAMVLAGGWSDRAGPARPTLVGVALFCLGLLVAGLAPDMWALVAGRLVQGFGGGLFTVAAYVVVGRAYPNDQHPRIFSAFAAAWVLPAVVGPTVAGVIVEHLGWRWVFLLVAFASVPATLMIWPQIRLITGQPAATAVNRRVPWAIGAAASLCLLYLGGQRVDFLTLLYLGLGLAGVVFCAPRLLPRGTFRAGRGLPSVVLLRGLAGAAFVQTDVFIPLLLTRERGLSPTLAGLTLTTGAICWSAGSWLQARQAQRLTSAARLRLGLVAIAVGVVSALSLVVPSVPVPVVLVGWAIGGFGMGLAYPTMSALVLSLSAPGTQGANSSALQVGDALLTTTVLAVGGSLFALLVDTPAGYLAAFSVALVPALLGIWVAGSTTPQPPVHEGEGHDPDGVPEQVDGIERHPEREPSEQAVRG